MPFSHHSHSGQFCKHARNTLQEMIAIAHKRGIRTLALTEHMPRDQVADLYDEEIEEQISPQMLATMYDEFYKEARRLQHEWAPSISLLVGMETEWIRPESEELIKGMLKKYRLDVFVGSLHHVYTISIDLDHGRYAQALEIAEQRCRMEPGEGLGEDRLFADYFDSQFDMLRAINPPVVGHFDLIRLLSTRPNESLAEKPLIWSKILRNLEFVSNYGGLLEANSSALRKGMTEPYPRKEIVKAFNAMGGRFVLSDDSHAVEQIGLNYRRTLQHLETSGVTKICYLETVKAGAGEQYPAVQHREIDIQTLWNDAFWKQEWL